MFSTRSYVVITNKEGKPRYVPNPFEDLYESVPKLSKVPDSIRNQLDYDDYRDGVGDAGGVDRDPDAKEDGRPTAPDDSGARFGNNLGGQHGEPAPSRLRPAGPAGSCRPRFLDVKFRAQLAEL